MWSWLFPCLSGLFGAITPSHFHFLPLLLADHSERKCFFWRQDQFACLTDSIETLKRGEGEGNEHCRCCICFLKADANDGVIIKHSLKMVLQQQPGLPSSDLRPKHAGIKIHLPHPWCAVAPGEVQAANVWNNCRRLGVACSWLLQGFPSHQKTQEETSEVSLQSRWADCQLLLGSQPFLWAQKANEVYMPAVTLILPDPRRTAWRQSVIKGFGDHWGAQAAGMSDCFLLECHRLQYLFFFFF